MSTSPRVDGDTAPAAEPYEVFADHVGEEFEAAVTAIRDIVATGELDYLAHYSSGVFDYSIDLLGDPPRHADALPGSTRRDELERLGRSLSHTMSDLDRTLQEARTGGLIRTVLHTRQGAAFCCSVVPREHLVGIVLNRALPAGKDEFLTQAPAISSADRAVSELATVLRRKVRLPSNNPGGWASADRIDAVCGAGPAAAPVVCGFGELVNSELLAACREAVRPTGLHLVGYSQPGKVEFTADCLDDRALAPFFTQISVSTRRRFYQQISRDLCSLVGRLSGATSSTLRGLLMRMVLDVEQGAIYYYRVRAGYYLVGVTIDQERVSAADDEMSRLAITARRIVAG